jgi:predicted Zn-dependent protease
MANNKYLIECRDAFLAQLDAAELAAQQITRHRDPVRALRQWATDIGKADHFDKLSPTQIGTLIATAFEASDAIGAEVVRLDHVMRDVLAEAGKP